MDRNVCSGLVARLSHIPYLRPATVEDVPILAPRLRPADVAELRAAGLTPLAALEDSFASSTFAAAVELSGEPVALLGVAPLEQVHGVGAPWLLASAGLFTVSFAFRRHCREVVDYMNELYPHLMNYVDARNVASIHWLHWCGFQFTRTVPAPADPDQTFIEFVRHRHV